jgi:hypothetical protein
MKRPPSPGVQDHATSARFRPTTPVTSMDPQEFWPFGHERVIPAQTHRNPHAPDDAPVLRSAPVRDHWRRRSVVWVVGAAIVALHFALPAIAAEPAEVENLIRQGVQLRRDGQDQRALPLFQKAYELARTPRTAAQLGLVEMALGYMLDADRHLTEGLAAPRDPWIKKNRPTLDSALRAVRVSIAELFIDGAPDGSEVLVNGKPAGRTPLAEPIKVAEGSVNVEVRPPGRDPLSKSISVAGGKRQRVTFELGPAPTTSPPPLHSEPPPVAPPDRPTPAPEVSQEPDPKPTPVTRDDRSSPLRTAAWVTAGGAAAALGFAVIETFAWRARVRDFNNLTARPNEKPDMVTNPPICETSAANRGGGKCSDLYDRIQGPQMMMIAGYAVGGALAIGSVVMFVASSPPPQEGSQQALTCGPWLPHAGAVCRLTF